MEKEELRKYTDEKDSSVKGSIKKRGNNGEVEINTT